MDHLSIPPTSKHLLKNTDFNTTEHASDDGEAERFMKVLNKTEKNSTQRGNVDRHSNTEYAYGV